MTKEYRNNHYVPQWYQKRFMLAGKSKYYRLDLKPEKIQNNDHTYQRKNLHYWSPKKIFKQKDLYTTFWGLYLNTDIEKFFFGQIDNNSIKTINYFNNFKHPSASEGHFTTFLKYMSLQKLRTPKGLNEFSKILNIQNSNQLLLSLQEYQNLYCATWTECIWQIADASLSSIKFIISDQPVTVYNRASPPLSPYVKKHGDPDIRQQATHTIFPLSLNKLLILTNLSWVRNPYQNEKKLRPNPNFFRDSVFNFLDIQTERHLAEQEVLEINYIIKSRAHRYIAGAEKEWLFPETYLTNTHWKNFGNGYLLMPEPRLQHLGGNVILGYEGGRSEAFSEYGHRPWQDGYEDYERERRERVSFEKFKAEWAAIHGPTYSARSFAFHSDKRHEDSEEMTAHYKEIRRK